jgi:hypothetical protein
MSGRDNGLSAASYKPLVDLHPRLADAMLDALAESGVAAYAAPAVRPFVADLYAPVLRGPVDRLWVDADAEPTARTVLERTLPALRAEMEDPRPSGDRAAGASRHAPDSEPRPHPVSGGAAEPDEPVEPAGSRPAEDDEPTTPISGGGRPEPAPEGPSDQTPVERRLDEDAIWAQLIARFNEAPSDRVPRWPVAEDLPAAPEPTEPDGSGEPDLRPRPTPGDVAAITGPPAGEPVELPRRSRAEHTPPPETEPADSDEHFVPPPPPPLPQLDTMAKLAWVGLAGGPLFFVVSMLVGWEIGGWTAICAGLAFGTGFVALVSRLRAQSDEDDGDDGAVV